MLVWYNLNTHLTAGLRAWIARGHWLAVYQLPPYAPDLNPVEGLWSVIRRGPIANRIITDPEHLLRIVRTSLRRIQWRGALINGSLTATALSTS